MSSSAFPIPAGGALQDGMTLLDYFAVHAPSDLSDIMFGDTSSDACKVLGITTDEYVYEIHYPMVDAKARYMWAKAMLEERKKYV